MDFKQWEPQVSAAAGWLLPVLIVFMAWQAAGLVWAVVSPAPSFSVQPFSNSPAVAPSALTAKTFSSVAGAGNLFGEYQPAEPEVQAVPSQDIPATRLKLNLQGVFATNDPGSGSAIIGNSRNETEFVLPGQPVFEQATLYQVYSDRVILRRSGNLETLYFEKSQGTTASARPSELVAQAAPSVRNVNGNPIVTGNSVAEVVSALREQAYQDPQALARQYGLSEGDDGYLVTRRARQLMFIGLRPGDRIVSVNDIPVGNAVQDVSLLDQAVPGAEVKIDIMRGNRQFSIYQTIPAF